MGRDIGHFYKHDRSKISTNLFYHLQNLIHHLQVIPQEHLFGLDLTIYITTNQENNNISNTDDIQYCVTPQKKLQCSEHIYAHSFGAIECYNAYFTTKLTHAGK